MKRELYYFAGVFSCVVMGRSVEDALQYALAGLWLLFWAPALASIIAAFISALCLNCWRDTYLPRHSESRP